MKSQSASHLIPFEPSKASSGADRRPIFNSLAPGFEYPVVHLIPFPHTFEVKNGHPFIKPQMIEHLELRCFSGNWFPKPSEINLSNVYEIPSPRWTVGDFNRFAETDRFQTQKKQLNSLLSLGFQVLRYSSDPSNAAPLKSTNGWLANLHQRIAPGVPENSHRNCYQPHKILKKKSQIWLFSITLLDFQKKSLLSVLADRRLAASITM